MSASLLFVGTSAGLAVYRPGIDGGQWQTAGSTLADGAVQAIVAADAETLLVAVAGAGAQQSFDGGATWSKSADAAPAPVGLHVMTRNGATPLANPRLSGATAYARLSGKTSILVGAAAGGALLFRSDDDGIHWEPAGMEGGFAGRIVAIVPDAASAATAWAGSDSGVLLRSTDYGRSWQVAARASAPILCLASAAT